MHKFFFIILILLSYSNKTTIANLNKQLAPAEIYLPVEGKILGIWSKSQNYSYYKDTLGYSFAVAGNLSSFNSCKKVFSTNIMESLSTDATFWRGIIKDYPAKLYTIDEPLINADNWNYTKSSLINAIVNIAYYIEYYRPKSELRIGVSSTDISKYLADYQYIAEQCPNVSFIYTSYDYPISARRSKWKFVNDNLPVKAYYINAKYDYDNDMFLALISYAEQLGSDEIWLYCYDGEENLETFSYYASILGWLKPGDN